ncbi:alpha/beta hydrolase [Roseomonas sp. HJA6]|uniref:Alpha/beta hydrolase n=1 Tax=Roseomonas alba TaxID=2846776 RepID=A0ABS7ABS8_9PROT|nr:alpha/beta hydrolase [Neoroseomonas alba]MBW6399749.1 alpha/beta hydrolase [Neoroseomonas alba]
MTIAPPPGLVPSGTRRLAMSRASLFVTEGGGDGPPILCIPGGYHGAWCFDAWLGLFAASGIAAAALELRGKGTLGTSADPNTDIAAYAADVGEAAGALGTAPVLLGHSLGALIALRAAVDVPAVAGLLLVAPSPPGNMPGVAAVREVPEGALIPPPAPEVAARRFLGGEQPEGFIAYHAALSPESPRALNDRYALRVAVDPARLAGIPTLVVEAGRDDAARHPSGQDAGIAALLGGQHRFMPELPHCMMLRPWAEAGAAPIIAWHRRLSRRRP